MKSKDNMSSIRISASNVAHVWQNVRLKQLLRSKASKGEHDTVDMVNVTIDGHKLQVPKSATVLTAAKAGGINVPSLCYHPELRPEGACRVCVVEVEGAKSLVASCVYPVNEGMIVHTNTAAVREARKTVVELLLANHPQDCLVFFLANCLNFF